MTDLAPRIVGTAPAGTTPQLAAMLERYKTAYIDDNDPDEWAAAAEAFLPYRATTPADIATKLLASLHYLSPGHIGRQPAIDCSDFQITVGAQMLMGALDDLLALADHPVPA